MEIKNLSTLAPKNIHIVDEQSNESGPWQIPSASECSRKHLHSNRVLYSKIL